MTSSFKGTFAVARKSSAKVCVADIIQLVAKLAPLELAETWDNCGLQVGAGEWPVQKIWVALDPLPDVIAAAGQSRVDMVITHHPLLVRPLQTLDLATSLGRVIEAAIVHHTAIYAAHTNLDSARDGLNDILARRIGLTQLSTLVPAANPTNASDPLLQLGLGRVGRLSKKVTVRQLADHLKSCLNIKTVKVAGDQHLKVEHVAICSGSGGSLLDDFLNSHAQVYVSGDLRYHQARSVEAAGRALIDVGHFASEHIFIDPMVQRLDTAIQEKGWPVQVAACRLEKDPFVCI